MSEKLCLQWHDFKENLNYAFGRLRGDKEFTDVTLACEDGQQVEAHKVILVASSPFFEKMFQRNKHPHPLIYLRGFRSEDVAAILDFIYFGEANVYQDNLDSFLAITEELKLQGLTGSEESESEETESEKVEEEKKFSKPEPIHKTEETFKSSTTTTKAYNEEASKAIVVTNGFSGELQLQALDEKVKSLMERSENMIQIGKKADGKSRQRRAFRCKVCGKEAQSQHIVNHIEAHHMEGISIPCEMCDKRFSARVNLTIHKTKHHKYKLAM